jgi:quercetin dioxygenase-like cupin family protein
MKIFKSIDEVRPRINPKFGFQFQYLIDQPEARNVRTFVINFQSGQRTDIHDHPHEQIYYVLSGTAVFGFPHNEEVIPKNGLVFISPGERHFHGATDDQPCSQLVIFIHPPKRSTQE